MKFINDNWANNHILSRDAALLRWQHSGALRDGDQDAPPSILLAWQDDRIVGMLGMTYVRWLQAGCTYLGAWSSHWFVLPELRKSHLSLLLIRRAADLGPEVIGSLGVNDRAISVIRNIGYEVVSEIARWVAIIDPAKTAALLVASGMDSSLLREILTSCRERVVRENTSAFAQRDWEIEEWHDDIAPEWDNYWEQCLSPGFTGVVRDSTYLRWRYSGHPTFRYRTSLARHRLSGKIGGMVVSRIETVRDRAERVMRVVDVLSDNRAATECLLEQIICEARENDVAFADFYCTKLIDGLADAGFRVEHTHTDPFPVPFRLQPLEMGGRPLNAAIRLPAHLRGTLGKVAAQGALYLTKSDGDQDRPN
jgi:hypothetical protein